jgi:SSS family solute:Na+ symporter
VPTISLGLAVLIAYAAFFVVFGAIMARRVKRADDFLVAGRRLGPGLIASTFLAANIGSGSTVGATGIGYRSGWTAWWWVGCAGIGSLILAQVVGPRICWRRITDGAPSATFSSGAIRDRCAASLPRCCGSAR